MSSSSSSTADQLVTLFLSFGLSESKANETVKNSALSKRLEFIANQAIKDGFSLQENGKLYYHLASKMKSQHEKHSSVLVRYIGESKLNTVQRIEAALQFFLSDIKESVDFNAFEQHCGIGVEVTADEIRRCVEEISEKYKQDTVLLGSNNKRLKSSIMYDVQKQLKWAEGKIVADEVNRKVTELLLNTHNEQTSPIKSPDSNYQKKISGGRSSNVEKYSVVDSDVSILDLAKKLNFHKPGENYTADGYIVTDSTEKLLKAHLKATKGKVRTRFPPEPNGILHIGHAKAININFGYAAAHDGLCFLRYDDTNPEKEEEQFFVGIRQMVEWLGYKPHKVTHSSDYFDQLYEWAIKLINKGLAYVCHQKQEEIKGFNPPPSPWRDSRSVEENLILFQCMKNGLYEEGGATLRMKVVLEEGKQDPVAYRIKYLPHPRTGQKWCIYPTYDYTHCLCDSIENITHSLCTKEFQSRRSTYYWLCNALDIYCPVQWEYGRLNMNYTVVSKRKIAKLIDSGIVKDWDDPRLYTLNALKRRGFPAEAINKFCAKMGITGAQAVVDPQMLESEVRSLLNETCARAMVVMEPLRVKIVNFSDLKLPESLDVADFPNDPSKGSHWIDLSDVIYIERSDFKSSADYHYRRLSLDQTAGLRYAGIVIRVKVVEYDNRERVSQLHVSAERINPSNKPKAFIHWASDPVPVELRLYDRLFFHKNPEDPDEVKEGFLSDINPNSLVTHHGVADKSIVELSRKQTFQFERVGFFCKDPSSIKQFLVFNRTVTLKEDANKL